MSAESEFAIDRIVTMLGELGTDEGCLPAAYLYNEGWMLRLILDAVSRGGLNGPIDTIKSPTRWFSEAKLSTPFNRRGSRVNETSTNVDAVLGEFKWREGTKTGVCLIDAATRFEVFEAKMYSRLSSRVTAASWYDQAVRTVACMANTIAESGAELHNLTTVGFWLVAPDSQIKRGLFTHELHRDTMRKRVDMRIEQFSDIHREELEEWRSMYFEPLLGKIKIQQASWEDLIDAIHDEERRDLLRAFYFKCVEVGGRDIGTDMSDCPVRGGRYTIDGDSESREVVVCGVGGKKSRVCYTDRHQPSFKVSNCKLQEVGDAGPMDTARLKSPKPGEVRLLEGREVRVVTPRRCESEVEYVDSPGREWPVVNFHLLVNSGDTGGAN